MTPPAFVAVPVYCDLELKELEHWSVQFRDGTEIVRVYHRDEKLARAIAALAEILRAFGQRS